MSPDKQRTVREQGEYGWMMCTVLEMKQPFMSAPMVVGVYKIVVTLKMQVFCATVSDTQSTVCFK